ncbi:MAG: hypothetical protein BZY79_01145 [SAR202 cluster bacterium Casp-Chloro-G4]|nr:MAG: hypothetical protein BZY79_01145 [SAR202 cluster bacterium Casp-Chloro-G4]
MSHGALLRQMSDDPEMASMVMYDYTKANIDPQLKGILDFATKLTLKPGEMEETDIQTLRVSGLSDEEILSVVMVTCNFNFMTRLADALGVVFEDSRQQQMERWLTGPVKDQEWLMKQK